MHPSVLRRVPILDWGRRYNRDRLTNDLIGALIVTIMLIPQSLAYALLAGLPAEAGLYASIVPILLYTVLGTSGALAVGPVAVVSLMTAAAVGEVAASGTAGYAAAALTLAALSGAILLAMGLLRLGFLASFLSHPVISGFISASGILIATSQFGQILGISAGGDTLPRMLAGLWAGLGGIHPATLAIGLGAAAFLFWARKRLKPALMRAGAGPRLADIGAKAGPVAAVVVTTALAWGLGLEDRGVRLVGQVPQALPPFTLPPLPLDLVRQLALPALLISVIGFVESISVAQTLAARRRQRIDPDQELIALGAANLGAAFTGGFPVTGGFSRSVVNFEAGSETPAAGAFTAIGLALAAVALTPLIYFLPKATLAATIVVAVLSLVDLGALRRAWTYSLSDFLAVSVTIGATLILGVEAGVTAGVALSILLFLYKTSRPHIAEVGLVPGTQHFRNIRRYQVETHPTLVTLRVDESLYFANARYLEDYILARVVNDACVRDVVLLCSAINEIDLSALESLEAINHRLGEMGMHLHLSEVKGPVMDRLKRSDFLSQLSGRVFMSQMEAVAALTAPSPAGKAET